MATGIGTHKLASKMKIKHYLSGNATTAKSIGWVDMSNYGRILITCCAAALTGLGVTAFKILANSASDGSGTSYEVKAHALSSAPDAAGDTVVLECSAEEIHTLGSNLRYVSANITTANAADNIVVTYIQADPRFASQGLTADSIA